MRIIVIVWERRNDEIIVRWGLCVCPPIVQRTVLRRDIEQTKGASLSEEPTSVKLSNTHFSSPCSFDLLYPRIFRVASSNGNRKPEESLR